MFPVADRRTILLALAASIALATPAFAQTDLAALEASAKAEGQVVVYHSNPQTAMQPIADAFTAKYGIPVELFHATSAPLGVRFANEAGAGDIVNDILYTTDAAVWKTNPDWFLPLSPEVVPNVARLPAPDNLLPNAAGSMQGSFILVYNKDKLAEADVPKTWEELGDPKWNGKLIMPDPRGSASYIKIMALLKDRYPGLLQKIAANAPHLVESAGPGVQQLAAGTGEILAPALPSHALALMEKGAPIAYVTLQGPELTRNTWAGITAKAPHPNAARLFLNFWLSDEGVAAHCGTIGAGNRSILDMSGALGCEKMEGTPEYLDDSAVADDVKAEVAAQLGLP